MADHPSGEDHSKRASDVRHLGGEANWSRRYRANLHRLNSGDRSQIAALVDGLSQRHRDYGLSPGE
jgi:RNA polymerase-interacting CarD/CdnL/TRCF family regulator